MRARWVLVATLVIGGCGDGESASESSPPGAPATTSTPSTSPPPTTLAATTDSAASVTEEPGTPPLPPTTTTATMPVPPQEHGLNGEWQVTSGVVNGVPVQLIDSAPITLTVDGSELSGVAACNRYDFIAVFGDATIGNVTPSATEMGCVTDGVNELEQLYLESIGPSATYVVDDTTLTWKSPTATWVFARVPSTPALPLVGTTWVLNGVIEGLGAFTTAGIETAQIVFADDGTFHGSTGCRDFTGAWTVDGDVVTTNEVTVEGACTGTLTDVDEVVVQVLNEGFAGAIDGDHLGAHPRDNLGLDYFAAE